MSYTYDDLGLPSGWSATNGWRQELSRSNSARLDEQRWYAGAFVGAPGVLAHSLAFDHYGDGWLRSKTIDGGEPISYGYDELGRLSTIWAGPPPGAVAARRRSLTVFFRVGR